MKKVYFFFVFLSYILPLISTNLTKNEQALFDAINSEDTEKIKQLINNKVDIDIKNSYGETPLMQAVSAGSHEIVVLLLDAGALRESQNNEGSTPLIVAAFQKDLDFDTTKKIIQALFLFGVNKNARNNLGTTALMAATKMSNVDVVDLLINEGANPNLADNNGHTPLMVAAYNRSNDILEKLLNAGVNLNAQSIAEIYSLPAGSTALMIALSVKNFAAAKSLINAGVDITIANAHGQTAFYFAQKAGGKEIMSMFEKKRLEELYDALSRGLTYRVSQFIDEGIDINSKLGSLQKTPLVIAIEQGHFDIVELLIKKGAELNIKGSLGRTPLFIAIGEKNIKLVEKLLEGGSSINLQDNRGLTPLMYALLEDEGDIVKLILLKNPNLMIKDMSEKTALDIAQERGNAEIINLIKAKMESKPHKQQQLFMEKLQLFQHHLAIIKRLM